MKQLAAINTGAILISFIPQIEDGLRILVLIGTIIYTILKIRNEVKK
tara:strand:- start:98 stop:238 length:141 start_codon:yes stop_codon:yes gene_type:complete